jgi:AcrR family transcriptional regulator
MPKQTFWNLPPAKRDAFTQIALEEFAAHDYNTASVTNIVARAGIAKGSVYQYFEDKQDLYLFLIEHAGQTLLAQVNDETRDAQPADFFERLRVQMSATLRAAMAHPLHAQVLRRSVMAPAKVREAMAKQAGAMQHNHFHDMVQHGINSGDLSPALDPDMATWFISAVVEQMPALIMAKLGMDAQQAATGDVAVWDSPVVESTYDQVIYLLKCGLSRTT